MQGTVGARIIILGMHLSKQAASWQMTLLDCPFACTVPFSAETCLLQHFAPAGDVSRTAELHIPLPGCARYAAGVLAAA
jgi:hypothetical protein